MFAKFRGIPRATMTVALRAPARKREYRMRRASLLLGIRTRSKTSIERRL